jgi:mannose-6-phosphate isomerase-like protein (cupin superfamily)
MNDKHPREMTAEERERWHQEAESHMSVFRYDAAAAGGPGKIATLVKRPLMQIAVHVLDETSAAELRSAEAETTWFVLSGKARFEDKDGNVLAELAPLEGIQTPAGTRFRIAPLEGKAELFQAVVTGAEKGATQTPVS